MPRTSIDEFKDKHGDDNSWEGYWWCVSGKAPRNYSETNGIDQLPGNDAPFGERIVEGHLFSRAAEKSVHLMSIDGEYIITVFKLNCINGNRGFKLGKEEYLPTIARLSKSGYTIQRLFQEVPLDEAPLDETPEFTTWQEVAQVFKGFNNKHNGSKESL